MFAWFAKLPSGRRINLSHIEWISEDHKSLLLGGRVVVLDEDDSSILIHQIDLYMGYVHNAMYAMGKDR